MPSVRREVGILFFTSMVITGIIQSSITGKVQLPFFGLLFSFYFISIIFVMAPLAIASFFVGWRWPVGLSLPLAALLGIAHRIKVTELGEPVLISDIANFQISPIMWAYLADYSPLLIGTAVLPIGFWAWSKRRPAPARPQASVSPWNRKRLIALGVAPLLATFLLLEAFGWIAVIKPTFYYRPWVQLRMANDHGYILSQILYLHYLDIEKPTDYSDQRISRVLAPFSKPSRRSSGADQTRPDVVLILLESFHDFSRSGQVRYKADPLPQFDQLRKESASALFLSPTFAGLTANAEYEVLTGLSANFWPTGTVVYPQHIKEAIPSVTTHYQNHGYDTFAFHNNVARFWSRDVVYPRMGFSQYFAHEALGVPINDRERQDSIIFDRSLELLKKRGRKPQFHFLLTIGTHGPYDREVPLGKWHDPDASIDSALSLQLNGYGEKLKKLDDDLGAYIKAVKKLPHPPVIILFSDHQPGFGTSRIPGVDEGLRKFEVEALIWNKPELASYLGNRRSLACLSPVLLRAADLPLTPYYQYLESFCRKQPPLGRQELSERISTELKDYYLLNFDRLFGKRYSVPF